jgi:hypothetical protein
MDNNTATTSYLNIEDAALADLTANQRWELHPTAKLSVDVQDDNGYIIDTIELNADSIITEIVLEDPTTSEYSIAAIVNGYTYNLQTNLDYDTQVRLTTK